MQRLSSRASRFVVPASPARALCDGGGLAIGRRLPRHQIARGSSGRHAPAAPIRVNVAFAASDRSADLVARYPLLAVPLAALGCGAGDRRSVAELAVDTGRAPEALLDALAIAARRPAPADATDWSAATLGELVAHLVGDHHVFAREELARLRRVAAVLARAGADGGIATRLDTIARLLIAHLDDEERRLFPACTALDSALDGGGLPSRDQLENALRAVARGHRDVEDGLPPLAAAAHALTVPPALAAARAALADGLAALVTDLARHQREEDDILLPAALHARDVLSTLITRPTRPRRDRGPSPRG